jgi:hypothetical protein
MRSTLDLINELENEAENFIIVAIAVGFERETKFVFHKPGEQQQIMEQLNEAIQKGGEPIGLVGIRQDQATKSRTFYTRPLAEFQGEAWVEKYLDSLMGAIRVGFEEAGGVSVPKPQRN